MKRYIALICAAMLCMTLSSCGQSSAEEITDTAETSATQWNGEPPKNILNTDFRNMVWGMNPTEVVFQEQRYEDFFGDHLIYMDDILFGGFDSRLYYYFNENWECTSAAYMITLSLDDPKYDTAYDTLDKFITGLFAPPDEGGGNIRTTPTAIIELTMKDSDIERVIQVKFTMPEGYIDKKKYSKIIYFENGEPVGSSVSP